MVKTGEWVNEQGNTCYGVNPEWKKQQKQEQEQQNANVRKNTKSSKQ